ncbi:translation initiation factor eIF-3 subunit 9 [Pseudohyphozyma bogoriensis]|nr:translation initiation factor eIF-3 subunit 9 [Pseudohyphozyma bogoriensis]
MSTPSRIPTEFGQASANDDLGKFLPRAGQLPLPPPPPPPLAMAASTSNLDDIDYSDLEAKYSSHYESPLEACVILDGCPVVGPDRADKLISAIVKSTLKEVGIKLSKDQLEMPMDAGADGKSKGFVFVTLASESEAKGFQRGMHGVAFDKRHTFSVIPFLEVEKYEQLTEEWKEPETEEWVVKEHFKHWLGDQAGRDQLIMYKADQAAVLWNGRNGAQEAAYEKNNWTDSYFQWSPFGTLLGTIHAPGVALWAGPSFSRLNRFLHPSVQLIDFSPRENYLVTWSPKPIEVNPDSRVPSPFTEDDAGHMVAVWDVATGGLLRTFPMVGEQAEGEQKRIVWPMFKWSPDEKYLARVTPGQQISVYEVPTMTLLGKKSIKVDGVVDFEWAPMSDKEKDDVEAGKSARENILAFWTPEVQNQPARVTLMTLPSRQTIRSKNLFNVHDCKIHWQSAGDYLCVKVDRHTKTKKTQYCNLELFRLREKDCPVQVIEIKDAVTAFAWEPKGDRFTLITTNDPLLGQVAPGVLLKTSISFYGFDSKKADFLLLKTIDQKYINTIYWSPKGRHVVLAQIGSNSKFEMEFWDLDLDKETEKSDDAGAGIRMITTAEHYGMTDIEWDPSGRYVATSASIWMNAMEAGYAIWDFKGQELVKQNVDKFKQLLWRPRPPTLLTRDDQKRIRKNLREYSRRFEEQDQLDASNDSAELIAHRQRLIDEWNSWRANAKATVEAIRKDQGKAPRKTFGTEKGAELEVVEEWVEEVISETVEAVEVASLVESPTSNEHLLPSSLPDIRAAHRRLLQERYSLGDGNRQSDLNEIAAIAQRSFGDTILITALLDGVVTLLGKAPRTGDEVDWEFAVRFLTPGKSETDQPMDVLVVDDGSAEWMMEINSASGTSEPLRFCACAPINLPLPNDLVPNSVAAEAASIPIGGFILVSSQNRAQGSFNSADQSLLLSLSHLVTKELQRGHDEILRQKQLEQNTFLHSFLQLALSGDEQPLSARRESTTASLAMEALKEFSVPDSATSDSKRTKSPINKTPHIFGTAVERLCSLSPGSATLLLDLRAFAASALEGNSMMAAYVEQPNHLFPIKVLGSKGFDDVEERLRGQKGLKAIEQALRGWHQNTENEAFRSDTLEYLLPASSRASLAVPILDHTNVPALLLIMSSPLPGPMMTAEDKGFVKNMGQVCLSTLLREQVVTADRAKLAFVSQISHELRTPIHGLGGQLELLRQALSPEELVNLSPLLTTADVCLDSLRTILDDTLDFAKLRAMDGSASAPLVANDIVNLPTFLTDLTKATWARKLQLRTGSSLDHTDEPDHPSHERSSEPQLDVILDFAGREEGWNAQVNSGELRRIITNILGNAFQFCEEGYIRLALETAPSPDSGGLTLIKLVISDSGIGMSEMFINHELFTPFQQASSFSPGCGLGAAIARDLVTRMNGEIKVISTLGEGTQVEVLLPILLLKDIKPAPPTIEVLTEELGFLKRALKQRFSERGGLKSPDLDVSCSLAVTSDDSHFPLNSGTDKIGDLVDRAFSNSLGKSEGKPADTIPDIASPDLPAPTAMPPRSGSLPMWAPPGETGGDQELVLRVFAAEDNPLLRSILGYECRAVEDGQKALDTFKKGDFRPDVSIFDIGMPLMDGLEAAFAIREYEGKMGWPRHRIIAFTALASPRDKERGIGPGGPFDSWLVKGNKSMKDLEKELADVHEGIMSGTSSVRSPSSQPVSGTPSQG